MKNIKTTLIISTYNRPDALMVCLDSIRHQSILPHEIVIGDDGSTDETRDAIESIRADFPVPIVHVWHEDNGFQLAQMRNKSVVASSGDYIIEIDGDIFLHPRFIEDHLRFAQKGYYVKGGRVNLDQKLSDEICNTGVSRRIHSWTKGIESKPENATRMKLLSAYLAPRYRRHSSPGLGCNMSFWKDDFIKINGYDEKFVGWGGEDHDFALRLQNLGLQKRYLKFAGIVYHLWHEDKFMQNVEENFRYKKEQEAKKTIRCEKGVDQYL